MYRIISGGASFVGTSCVPFRFRGDARVRHDRVEFYQQFNKRIAQTNNTDEEKR